MSRRAEHVSDPVSTPPRVVFLVPRRPDHGHRDSLWALCRGRWEQLFPDWPVYEGHHTEGLFNRSAAINLAGRMADADGRWDVAIVIDSDVMVRRSQVVAAVERAAAGAITWAHLRWREFSEFWTKRTLADGRLFGPEFEDVDLDLLVARTNPISWSCCIAIPRASFDDMGGFDERFVGWGWEDGAWAALARGLYPWDRITVVPGDDAYPAIVQRPADVINLWHPRSTERIVQGEPASTGSREYIRNALLGRRYQVAVIRDRRIGDQPGEERLSEDLAEVHVRNLTTDDRQFLSAARDSRMPEASWEDWWPTLEELRDGAREHRTRQEQAEHGVTVVVHTGGVPAAWPERRAYLEASIASLTENVTGPIVQRVIYDCWGDPAIRTWLGETFGGLGFYVVGPTVRPTYTEGMRFLWSYIARRARGEFVFQVEDDFTYDRPVDLTELIGALGADPRLSQMALLRGAFYPRELEAGGIVEEHPDEYELHAGPPPYLTHRLYFTANPCLFRRSLAAAHPWPDAEHSETAYARLLNRDPNNRFGMWGAGEPWITHLGVRKAAEAGY